MLCEQGAAWDIMSSTGRLVTTQAAARCGRLWGWLAGVVKGLLHDSLALRQGCTNDVAPGKHPDLQPHQRLKG